MAWSACLSWFGSPPANRHHSPRLCTPRRLLCSFMHGLARVRFGVCAVAGMSGCRNSRDGGPRISETYHQKVSAESGGLGGMSCQIYLAKVS